MKSDSTILAAMGYTLPDIPFPLAAKQYLEAKATAGRARRSIYNSKLVLETHLGPRWEKLMIWQIKGEHCQAWADTMLKDEKLFPSTIRLRHQLAKSFFKWCARRRWILWNPMDAVDSPRMMDHPPKTLSPEAYAKLHTALEMVNPVAAVSMDFLVATGMRRSEYDALDMADLTPEGLVITGRKARDWYCLPIPEPLAIHLKTAVCGGRSGGPVFTLPSTQLLVIGKKAAKAVIPEVRFTLHTLRHTCASWMVSAGADLMRIRSWMGHKQTSMTERYARLALRDYDNRYKLIPERVKAWNLFFTPGQRQGR